MYVHFYVDDDEIRILWEENVIFINFTQAYCIPEAFLWKLSV